MYRNYFNLAQEPFHVTPDPEFFFLSASHKEALASIIYGIEQRKGFISIVGEVGLGKTTVLRTYLESSQNEHLKTVYIFNANLSFFNLLQTICREFDTEARSDETFEIINQLHEILISEYEKDRNVVLIIDEAQNMPVETLENLRMLSNLESTKDKLIQIVLIGQPELQEKLNQRSLRQLKQRIAIRVELTPLSKTDSLAYIRHRLTKASIQAEPIFTPKALKLIIKEAQGVPRIINILCDNALIAGFGYDSNPVTGKIVKEVIQGYRSEQAGHSRGWVLACGMAILVFGGCFFFFTGTGKTLVKHSLTAISRNFDAVPPPDPTKGIGTGASKITRSVPKGTLSSTLSPTTGNTLPLAPAKRENRGKPLKLSSNFHLLDLSPLAPGPLPLVQGSGLPWLEGTLRHGEFCADAPPHFNPGQSSTTAAPHVPSRAQRPAGASHSNQPPAAQAAADHAEDAGGKETVSLPVVRVVQVGDTLNDLVTSVYGFSNAALIQWVKNCNPQIHDVNTILVGSAIRFPAYPGSKTTGASRP